jgi:starch synthase (maltosyl-transferring)
MVDVGVERGLENSAGGMAGTHQAAADGRRRAVIENVLPSVDGGRFPIKRCIGDTVVVEADVFVDGHDSLRCLLLHRQSGERNWHESEMTALGNDRWRGQFTVDAIGRHEYSVIAWADSLLTWRRDLDRWTTPADVAVSLATGARLIAAAAQRASGADAKRLQAWSETLMGNGVGSEAAPADPLSRRILAHDAGLHALLAAHADRSHATRLDPALPVTVDPPRACFSAWYEMFPRSASDRSGAHGTFRDVEARLPHVASLGFDVLYLPPIHPIGRERRKGPNNAVTSREGDPGSPWAIGAAEGGHKSVHPALGTAEDFRRLVRTARDLGIEVALDIAFQCAPDHPYVKEHPSWFRHRPDGSVQYAENPPKKYEDIYPFNFETDDWQALWNELKSVFEHWIGEGVRIFRVDNPHTKPFAFWEWVIGEIKAAHPEVLFLSEAFTRPKIMHRLAKLGFSQSYTYFTWRNSRHELTEYFTELTQHASREYFRPNAWPNTPDILHEYLQHGGRPAFMIRLILAATLAANYGLYGPAYELIEHVAREPGSEEYLNSEKYQVRHWDLARPDSLRDLIARMNRIRRENAALQGDWSLRFHPTDNDTLLCFSKATADRSSRIIVVVNLDWRFVQSGWVELRLDELGIDPHRPFEVQDLLTDARYTWRGARNYVQLDPRAMPAHVLRVGTGAAARTPNHGAGGRA